MEAKGDGEVRRLNIIYFLSRNGQIEHPHLIRIHIFSRNGVHLRDVKRWLSELRGEDMVKSFAWSYKRKYKQTGFVWQDLLDEDLITPISDNEYILKGTQISSTPIYDDVSSYGEKKIVEHKESTLDQIEAENHKILSKETIDQENSPTLVDVSLIKQSSEIKEESPPFSSDSFILAYNNSIKLQKETHSTARKLKQQEEDDENENFGNNCLYSRCLYKSKNKKNGIDFDTSTLASSTTSTPSSSLRSRSYSRGSSNTVSRTMDTKNLDTAKMTSQRSKNYESMATSKPNGLSSFVGLFIPLQIVTFNL